MAPPRSLAGAAIAATAAAIILSCNLSLFPHLIVSSSKFPASTSPPSPTCLSGYPTGLFYRRKCARLAARVRELEASLAVTAEKAAAERRGRVRAQQSLRALSQLEPGSDEARPTKAAASASYPLVPIGTVESCFSTRNGTPRQPLVVTLARATLVLDPARVPAAALEGLASYSHCWILYVFHLNTDLDKLWKDPARSKLKAKVRVPRLKGGKMGVLATRSPHRPNPIGLSVAKVSPEMVQYFTTWIVPVVFLQQRLGNRSTLTSILPTVAQQMSLYASADEFQDLIKQALSWDIRSISQRNRPHQVSVEADANGHCGEDTDDDHHHRDTGRYGVVYHLHLEGIDVSYRIDQGSNIFVEDATLLPDAVQKRHGYLAWRDKLGSSVL
ncbi:Protein virR [Zea mays]|uniref:Protein virR n=1 Tax=Zea mays TaxID=4577 RepID=A0A1D6I4R2_MAIZE|nr:Protein virR [Zea mays]